MSIELMCPVCGAINAFIPDQAGSLGKCGHCQTPMYIPRPEEVPGPSVSRRVQAPKSGGMAAVAVASVVVALLAVGASVLAVGYFLVFPSNPKTAVAQESFAKAQVVKVVSSDSVTQDGALDQPKDEGLFKFKAPAAGTVVVFIDPAEGSKLEGRLSAYDAKEKELTNNDADADKRVGTIQFPVAADQEYFVKIAGFDAGTGKYKATFKHAKSLSGEFGNAHEVRLSTAGLGIQTWSLERAGDENMFKVATPTAGWVFAEVSSPLGSNLDAFVSPFDSARRPVGYNNFNSRGTRFYADSGKSYFVKVGSNINPMPGMGRTGAYTLTFRTIKTPADDYGNDFVSAHKVPLDALGKATLAGQIETDLDVDVFVFQSPKSGKMKLNLSNAGGSQLDAFVTCHDDKGMTIGLTGQIADFQAVQGQTYFAKVTPYLVPLAGRQKTGAYTLQFSMDSGFNPGFNPGGFDNSQQVFLDFNGAGSIGGNIFNQNDVVWYRVSPPKAGKLTVQLSYPLGSQLDAALYGHDNTKLQVGNGNGTSIVDVLVGANLTYYFKVSPMFFPLAGLQKTGAFDLKFSMDNQANLGFGGIDFTKAKLINLNFAGGGEVKGQIFNQPDLYKFFAPKSGVLHVEFTRPFTSQLDAGLDTYDAPKLPYGFGFGTAHANFTVTSGLVYYVRVNPKAFPAIGMQKTGSYTLNFRTENGNGGFNNGLNGGIDFNKSQELFWLGEGELEVKSQINNIGDVGFYRFKAPKTGTVRVNFNRPEGSLLDAGLNTYDSIQLPWGFGYGTASPNFPVTAGQVYYVRVVAKEFPGFGLQKTGFFTLKFSMDKVGGALEKNLPQGNAKVIQLKNNQGQADYAGNLAAADPLYNGKVHKLFQFAMTEGVTYQIDMKSKDFDSYLYLEDENGNVLAQDDDGGGFPDARIVFKATRSGKHRIVATHFGQTTLTGEFTLSVREP